MMAKQELSLCNFPAICASSEFTKFICEVFEQELVEVLNKSTYFSMIVDVLTDITEQEMIDILYLRETGETSCKFL